MRCDYCLGGAFGCCEWESASCERGGWVLYHTVCDPPRRDADSDAEDAVDDVGVSPDVAADEGDVEPEAADTAADTGVESVVDASCGDPALMGAFPSCRASSTEDECAALGGSWVFSFCECPTGQGGCHCTASRDCLSWCMAHASSQAECNALTVGTCLEVDPYRIGCACEIIEGMGVIVCDD
ncbi:MAG: hypothetical protein HY905_21520 [Deltaproteobacteria bacterium]|nr:hypothetical protein [Deltaproteobacteria bacterium]